MVRDVRRSRQRRRLGLDLSVVFLASFALGAARPPPPIEHGRQLFTGEQALVARMVGHSQTLPPEAVRCSNCHQHPTLLSSTAPLADDNTRAFGPKLEPRSLTQLLPRRGGPPSRYDAKSLCRLLREGIDPAHVMIPQTMPRYSFTDIECEALWTFLTAP